MKLYFLRHGIAEDGTGAMRDFDRALTSEGRTQLDSIAVALVRMGVKPNLVLSSPLVRARETAEIVAPVLGAPLELADELAAGCHFDDLQRMLHRYTQEALMVVGHEPDFSAHAARLINADERGIVLKKAGLIRIEIDGRPQAGRGRLTGLLTPKMLLLIAGGQAADAGGA
jgi:phosphohistidine phosphatase